MPQIGARTGIHVAGLGMHAWGCLPSSRCAHSLPREENPSSPRGGSFRGTLWVLVVIGGSGRA